MRSLSPDVNELLEPRTHLEPPRRSVGRAWTGWTVPRVPSGCPSSSPQPLQYTDTLHVNLRLHVNFKYLRFRLRTSLKGRMVIQRLFVTKLPFVRIAIRPFNRLFPNLANGNFFLIWLMVIW